MAEGQRRRVVDTGVGVNLLSALTGKVSEQLEQRRKEKQEMGMAFEKALTEAKIKEAFPSAEERINRRLFGLSQESAEPQFGAGRVGPPTTEQAGAQARRESETQALLRILSGGRATGKGVNVFAFDPATGTVIPAEGGRGLPVGSRVLPTRTTPEEARELSRARAAGAAAGTPLSPEQSALVQNFKELIKATSAADLSLSRDPGFKQTLLATGLPFQPGAGTLADELTNAADILLRMRSGAAINEQEYQRLRGLLPRGRTAISELFGNPNRSREQLARFNEAAQEILQSKLTKANFQGESDPIVRRGTDSVTGKRIGMTQSGKMVELP